MTDELRISDTLALPLDAATESAGILAKKGAGKSNAAVVLAEEMHRNGIPWVAIDPKGDWWGVRSSGDGKKPGLSVPVFGGKHGDFPLEPTAGALVAEIVLGDPDGGYLSCVIDVSQFTISEQRRFLLDFGTRLFRAKDEERVLHLFLEEAHEYLPQRVERDQTKLVSTWQRIVKQGRFKGLGVTVISQRSAALNKDVLTQVDSLYVLRTMAPHDRDAVKAWIEVHVGSSEVINSLHSLDSGEAWLWSPDRFDDPIRFQFRRRTTFDSGATPKVGQVRVQPRTLADVDLASIKEQMAETIERAKADDPKELRKRIAVLERELARRPTETETVEVRLPYVPPALLDAMQRAAKTMTDVAVDILGQIEAAEVTPDHFPVPAPSSRVPNPEPRRPTPAPVVASPAHAHDGEVTGITGGAKRMLEALATWPNGLTRSQLGTQAKVKKSGGTFGTYIGRLTRAGFITVEGQHITITDAGLEFVGGARPPQDPAALRDHWRSRFTGGARRMFDHLVAIYPLAETKAELADVTDISQAGGTFGTYLGRLRSNDCIVVDGDLVSAHPDLFLGEDR